jgi:hypothetical protein
MQHFYAIECASEGKPRVFGRECAEDFSQSSPNCRQVGGNLAGGSKARQSRQSRQFGPKKAKLGEIRAKPTKLPGGHFPDQWI